MTTPVQNQIDGTKQGAIGYVLKGFPRLSEMFIASEIYRLERLGIDVRLSVIKPSDELKHHGIVNEIRAKPDYLPQTSSLSETSLRRWLALHLEDFLPALRNVARRRPIAFTRAAGAAFAQAIRARRTLFSWPRKLYLKEFFQAAWISNGLINTSDVRHLHAHFCHGATTVTWLASIITGIPFSFTAHAKDIYCDALNPKGLLRRKMRAAEFVVTCTGANREHLLKIEPSATVHCIYHGLNAEFTNLLEQSTPARPEESHLRALGVGRLVAKKGFDIFVEACAILHRRGLPFETVIVGEHGDHEAGIRKQISAFGLENHIRLVGPMEQASLYEEYKRAGVFCLPCRVLENGDRDGLPNVLMEAMACGLPVISTAVSGIPEIIKDGLNGTLIPPNDPVALANAIHQIHSNAATARKLALAGRRTVQEKFDGDRTAAELAALFRSTLRGA